MNAMLMAKGAEKIIRRCVKARESEKLLIITDPTLISVAEALSAAGETAGCETVVSIMRPREWDGEEPPAVITGAMAAADIVIFPTMRDIAHSAATKNALKQGTRIVSMAGCAPEILMEGGIEEDFDRMKPLCDLVAEMLGDGSEVRLTNPAGTDVVINIQGRPGNSHCCVADKPGIFTGVPNIEANIAPVNVEGTIVIDGSVPNLRGAERGVLREPIKLTVKNGSVVAVEGGTDARNLDTLWNAQKDPSVYHVAQLALGLNPRIRTLTGLIVNDHGAWGTVHFGIGTSANLGGHVKAKGHIDGILRRPTLSIDGKPVLADGHVLVDAGTGEYP